jgi:hypothetical protein
MTIVSFASILKKYNRDALPENLRVEVTMICQLSTSNRITSHNRCLVIFRFYGNVLL